MGSSPSAGYDIGLSASTSASSATGALQMGNVYIPSVGGSVSLVPTWIWIVAVAFGFWFFFLRKRK